jgi:hypothetical protein
MLSAQSSVTPEHRLWQVMSCENQCYSFELSPVRMHLLDNLVSTGAQFRRKSRPNAFAVLRLKGQFEPDRQHHGKIGEFLAF